MSMPMIVACPKCRASLKLASGPAQAKKIRCPKCKDVFAPRPGKAPASAPSGSRTVGCPGCKTVLKVRADFPAGKKLKCPKCARTFDPGKKPSPSPSTPTPAPAPRANSKLALKSVNAKPASAPTKSAAKAPIKPPAKPAAKAAAAAPTKPAAKPVSPAAKPKPPPLRPAPPPPELEPDLDELGLGSDLLDEGLPPAPEHEPEHEIEPETNGRASVTAPPPAKPTPAKKAAEADEYDEDEKKRQKRLLIIAIVLFVSSFGGYFLFFRGPAGPVHLPVYSVEGSVKYRGKPAVDAVVTFMPEKQEKGQPFVSPRGEVDSEGNFKLTTYHKDDGAPAGKYKVTIVWATTSEAARAAARLPKKPKADEEEKDVFDGKYANPDASGLTAEIKADTNKLEPFDLK